MGCARLGSRPWPSNLRRAADAVSLALARGVTFLDTADAYGRGLSERIIGRVIEGRRDRVVVATKCGLLKTPLSAVRARGGLVRAPWAGSTLATRQCYEPDYVRRAAEASLRRLGSDYIDVLLVHSPPAAILREGTFVGAMDRLQSAGKVRVWGVSVQRSGDAQLALELPGLRALEVCVNLCDTSALSQVIPDATRRGIAVIARQPFASGQFEQQRRGLAARPSMGVDVELSQRDTLASALHFCLRTPGIATTTVGMSRPEHVAANVAFATMPVSNSRITDTQRALCGAA